MSIRSALLLSKLLAKTRASNPHLPISDRVSYRKATEPSLGGADDCLLLEAPCGGRDMADHPVSLLAGQQLIVRFQKNLDHTFKDIPGYFTVSLFEADNKGNGGKEILKITDTSNASLTLYSAKITVPDTMCGHVIVQVRYVTNNPNAGPVFYQCADVIVRV
ncbi:hypothetical protein ElyMa_005474000 [Elysia marginata]|uniref:CUB domain-containing protein n=1 Tax=Elysia marginata TaxID=1093978 RepID=A0AAV4EQI3_9GAST|nr:hypothetical protein ElyMa_005474000 [Elysia marginata]